MGIVVHFLVVIMIIIIITSSVLSTVSIIMLAMDLVTIHFTILIRVSDLMMIPAG